MRAHTTGSFAVYCEPNGEEVTPRGRKTRALLAYLVAEPGAKVAKERLAALLWGDRADPQARSSLRQALRELRLALNGSGEVIFSDREHIWISAESLIEDAEDPVARHKDAFEDLDNITPEFDEWLASERNRRTAAWIAALQEKVVNLLAEERGADAAIIVDQIQALDPCNEDALQLGMQAEFQCAHPGGIAERYLATAKHLQTELGVKPSQASRELRDELIRRLTKRAPALPSNETDHEYFSRRATEERKAAAVARDERSRQVHEMLAERYEELIAAL